MYSKLAKYFKESPNKNKRNHKIDTITIHCTAGQMSIERLGEMFSKESRKASSNYGIGKNGEIGCFMHDEYRSWCSSSPSNDNRALTIEVSSDSYHPYNVTRKVYLSLIDLLTDLCIIHKIPKLLWINDKSKIGHIKEANMTVHRWFSNKACPGDYLMSQMWQITNDVNFRLNNQSRYKPTVNLASQKPIKKTNKEIAKEVIAGKWDNGNTRKQKLQNAGYNPQEIQREVNRLL